MTTLIATQSSGALHIWQRNGSGALRQVGQLAAGTEIEPELFATLVGDLSDALAWQPAGIAAPPARKAKELPSPERAASTHRHPSQQQLPLRESASQRRHRSESPLRDHPAYLAYHAPMRRGQSRRNRTVVEEAVIAALAFAPDEPVAIQRIAELLDTQEHSLRTKLTRLREAGRIDRVVLGMLPNGHPRLGWRLRP